MPENSEPVVGQPKHSAIASLMWQYVDELNTRSHWWSCTKEDPYNISTAIYISLMEQASALEKVLEKNYGPRETK